MFENYQDEEDFKVVPISLNCFLINIIKILGVDESLEADLINLLLEYVNHKIENLNRKILKIEKKNLDLKTLNNDLDENTNHSDLKQLFKGQEKLLQKKEALLRLLQVLKNEITRIREKNDHYIRLQERIPIISKIISGGLKNKHQEIENKLIKMLFQSCKTHDPLLYLILNKIKC